MTSSSQSPVLAGRTLDLSRPSHYLFIALIMGLMGAFFWAVRGHAGANLMQPALGWGLLWLYFSNRDRNGEKRPLSTPWIMLAITFGLLFGSGGWGAYISWVHPGTFYLDISRPETGRDIAPWIGYATLFFTGLLRGGVLGACMSWCYPSAQINWKGWVLRVASGVAGAFAMYYIVKGFPQFFLPFYGEGIYDNPENRSAIRALNTHLGNAPTLGFFFGFLVFEMVRRDWKAVGIMVIMALGFAVFMSAGAYWFTFRAITDIPIDWWKNWEMSVGLGAGLAFGLIFYLYNQPVSDATSYRFSARSWIIGAGFPIWFGSTLMFRNFYSDGLTHEYYGLFATLGLDLPFDPGHYTLFTIMYLIPVSIVFFLFARRAHHPEKMILQNIGFITVLVLFSLALFFPQVFYSLGLFIPTRMLYLIPAMTLLAVFLYHPKSAFNGMEEGAYPIPDWLVVMFLAIIATIGMIMNLDPSMPFHNHFLMYTYSILMVVSLVLYFRIPRVGASGP